MIKRIDLRLLKSIGFSVFLICSALLLWQCRTGGYAREGYNVILISLDTLRADHLGTYGYPKNTSPHLDQFAEKSLVFKNSFSNSGWTLPSHMSLMTSLYPTIHGVIETSMKLSGSTRTLAEALQENGYTTAAFTAGYLVSKIFGFDKGFDLYKEDYDYPIETPGQGWRLKEIAKSLAFWLNAHAEEKFFLFVHCYDTHEPFLEHEYLREFESGYSGRLNFLNTLPDFLKSEEYKHYSSIVEGYFNINVFYNEIINKKSISLTEEDKEHMIALYDNEIRFVDFYFGKLMDHLEHLDLLEKTIIILWSDHGEELLERGKIQHGGPLFDELIRVPLIVYIPGYKGQKSYSRLAQSIDIAPTLLDMLCLEPEKKFMGISLFGKKNHFIVGQEHQQNIIRTKKYKLMTGPTGSDYQLYHLKKNPEETVDISPEKPNILTRLETQLLWTLNQRPGEKVKNFKPTKEDIEKLRALGYIK